MQLLTRHWKIIESNHKTKLRMIEKIISLSGGSVEDKVLTILGITFKPNTDDLRDAPSLLIVPALEKLGAKVRIVDPKGRDEGLSIFKNAEWFDDVYDAASDSSMIIILTEWNEFRSLDLNRIAHSMRNAAMADLRNIYSAQKVFSEGFIAYDSVGQKPHTV